MANRITTLEQLKDIGALCFYRIEEGIKQYDYQVIKLNALEARQKTREWSGNGADAECNCQVYLDFYYLTLPQEAKQKVLSVLNKEEVEFLTQLEQLESFRAENEVIFEGIEPLLEIALKLNECGMLFSTIYLVGSKMTLWGNFNGEYVVFREKCD